MASYTIASICNMALSAIGYSRTLGNIYDGSNASIVAVQHWGHTRDTLLYEAQPIWAHKDNALTLLKSAPNITNGWADYSGNQPWNSTFPPLPWLYEYAWPADCVRPLQVKVTPNLVPNWRPRYKPQRMMFDTSNSSHVILTNYPDALLNYIGRVLDPNNWNADFVELMVQAMMKRFETEFAKMQAQPKQQQQGGQNGGNAPG